MGLLFSKTSTLRTWNDLPDDILDIILNKIVLLSDFIRFGGVCKNWYIVFSQRKRHRIERYNNEVPLLFVTPPDPGYSHLREPLSPSDNNIVALQNQFFHILENKCDDSKSPVDYPPCDSEWSLLKVLGASYGWLATIISNKTHYIISLKNPITGNTLSLAPILASNIRSLAPLAIKDLHIKLVVLSCNPSIYPDQCVVAYIGLYHIGFIRLRGKTWNVFPTLKSRKTQSILFHKGKWYVLAGSLELFVIDCFWDQNDPDKCAFKSCKICKEMYNFEGEMSAFEVCRDMEAGMALELVEHESGELLVIGSRRIPRPFYVVMCKLVLTQDKGIKNMKGHWVRVHNLGGNEVLFFNDIGSGPTAICSKPINLEHDSVYVFNTCMGLGGNEFLGGIIRIVGLNEEMQEVEYVRLCGYFGLSRAKLFWIKQVVQ